MAIFLKRFVIKKLVNINFVLFCYNFWLDFKTLIIFFFQVIEKAKNAFASGKTKNKSFRKKQLTAMLKMIQENESAFIKALLQDLKKVCLEVIQRLFLLDFPKLFNGIKHFTKHN